MKKRVLLLASLLTIPLMAGCAKSSTALVYLPFAKMYDEDLDYEGLNLLSHVDSLSYDEYEKKIRDKEDFFLFTYGNTSNELKNAFDISFASYLKISNAPCYFLSKDSYGDDDKTLNPNKPTLYLFENGKVIHKRSVVDASDPFLSANGIMSWMDERAAISDMIFINEKQLDNLFKGDSEFTVGFVRESCGDCKFLKENLLYNYNKKHNNTSYLIDCDNLESDYKLTYGLTHLANEDYGYDSGYVPTFFRYAPTEGNKAEAVIDGAVYLNDKVTMENGKYVVSSSYYSETRKDLLGFYGNTVIETKVLEGLTLSEDEIINVNDTHFFWKNEKAAVYHDPILTAFLDAYIAIK